MGQSGNMKNDVQMRECADMQMKKFLNSIKINLHICTFAYLIILFSCTDEQKKSEKIKKEPEVIKTIPPPDFNADSAYGYVQKQVDFGPRVPGAIAHAKCADYLLKKLKSFGLETILQKGVVTTFDNKQFNLKNIIGSYKSEATTRILLTSHWDCRPFADEDTKDPDKPFDSANDGASGVGVLLELARQLQIKNPTIGVDIIFFDLEDYGESENTQSWCLGSQYWSKNLHKPGYYAKFGVLLDMVGAPNATFPKEGASVRYAKSVVDKVWDAANNIGYSNYFAPEVISFVGIDDHIHVNKAGIPCIDIIHYDAMTGGFGAYHHTHNDNMQMIDSQTLKAVGQTLLQVIYSEK